MLSRLRLILPLLLLTACGTSSSTSSTTLTVFAAASLGAPFEQIGAQFRADHPGVSISFNFAGSQQLAQQLNQGAPCDLFASASQGYMDQVVANGRVEADNWQVFARNQLVVVYPVDMPLKGLSLASLALPGLHVLLAAPEVPAGHYTQQFLEKASMDPAYGPDFQKKVMANVVSYEDNVKSVVAKVALGTVDAGIVYTSDVSGEYADKFGQIAIPDDLNVIATYPMGVISDSKQPELAKALLDFILSPSGQTILTSYGFLPPGP